MLDPAAPAPPPAACLGAIEREVRWLRIIERALGEWSNELIADAEDPTPRRIGQIVGRTLALPEVDPARAHVRLQTARLDERAHGVAGDKAPAAAARAGRTAARRRAPRGFQFACNPLICLDRTRNPFPNVSTTKGFVGRGGAQTPIWVVEAPEAGGGGRRARG